MPSYLPVALDRRCTVLKVKPFDYRIFPELLFYIYDCFLYPFFALERRFFLGTPPFKRRMIGKNIKLLTAFYFLCLAFGNQRVKCER